MKSALRLLEGLSILFVIVSVFGVLFWPAQRTFIFDDILLPFALIKLGLIFLNNKKLRWIIALFVAIATWGIISDFVANNTFRTSHLGLLIRWLKWPTIIATIVSTRHIKIEKQHLINFISFTFLALALINLILLVNPFHFGEFIHMIYSPKVEVLLGNYHEFGGFRLSGTMRNPNNNAAIFGLFLLFFLCLNPKKYWKYCVLAFFFIFLTQSRTMLLIILGIIALVVLRNNSRKMNMLLIPTGLIGVIALLFMFRSTNLMSILSGKAFLSNSWTDRMSHYSVFFNSSASDKFLGHGIILDPLFSVGVHFDSEYLSILYQYGIIGLILLVLIILYLPLLIKRCTGSSFFGWLLILFILGIGSTNFVFLNVEIISLLSLLLGSWLFLNSTDEIENNTQEKAK